MAKKVLKSVSINSADRKKINDNFTELYAATPWTSVTATAAELNVLHSSGLTAAEAASLAGRWATVTTTATPATGTCGVQFQFKNAAGSNIAFVIAGLCYSSDVNGVPAAITSGATLTNGTVTPVVTTTIWHYVTNATGGLGITLTSSSGSRYITFVLPGGKLVTSTVCTVN